MPPKLNFLSITRVPHKADANHTKTRARESQIIPLNSKPKTTFFAEPVHLTHLSHPMAVPVSHLGLQRPEGARMVTQTQPGDEE